MPPVRLIALAAPLALLARPGLAATLTDVRPIPLKPGVNAIAHLSPDGRDGVIVQGFHSDSPIADGGSIQFLVLLRQSQSQSQSQSWGQGDDWESVGVQTPSKPDEELIMAVPHVGEDWKRTVTFARAKVDGTEALVLLVAQRDMSRFETVYTPVPVDVMTYRLQHDDLNEQDQFALVDRQRAAGCYQNAWLALKQVAGVPLPQDYEGPPVPQACPK